MKESFRYFQTANAYSSSSFKLLQYRISYLFDSSCKIDFTEEGIMKIVKDKGKISAQPRYTAGKFGCTTELSIFAYEPQTQKSSCRIDFIEEGKLKIVKD